MGWSDYRGGRIIGVVGLSRVVFKWGSTEIYRGSLMSLKASARL